MRERSFRGLTSRTVYVINRFARGRRAQPLKRRHAFILAGSDRFSIVGTMTWSLYTMESPPRSADARADTRSTRILVERGRARARRFHYPLRPFPLSPKALPPLRTVYGITQTQFVCTCAGRTLTRRAIGIISQSVARLFTCGDFLS